MTSEQLIKYSEDKKGDFIKFEKEILRNSLFDAAFKQKKHLTVDYIPLLEQYYKEICGEGMSYTLDGFKITFTW